MKKRAIKKRPSKAPERNGFLAKVDELNAAACGGESRPGYGEIGELPVPSGTLVLGDPQQAIHCFEVAIEKIRSRRVLFRAEMCEYPDGTLIPRRLDLEFESDAKASRKRVIGSLGIDSGKAVIADKGSLEAHWAASGPDRIGVISTMEDQEVVKLLKKRLRLKVQRIDELESQIVGPVSEELEAEILAVLESTPEYADYPFMHFHLRTNSTFDRINAVTGPGQFLPIGNQPQPELLVCQTGRGDGEYEVRCEFAGRVPIRASVIFMDDDE